jgi:hypothetical protein
MLKGGWNTLVPASSKGQRIGYVIRDDDSVVFYDVDRNAFGLVPFYYMTGQDVRRRIYEAYVLGQTLLEDIDADDPDVAAAKEEGHIVPKCNYPGINTLEG